MGDKITIGFKFINEFGDEFSMETKSEAYGAVYCDQVDFVGQNMNNFLRQCGFCRHNDYIFMESVNEEEYEAISAFLKNYRNNEKQFQS